jgi:uncharacterized protein (UPF0332 family)
MSRDAGRREMDRAGQELKAACLLADQDFMPQAVSRAYFAALYAAEAALLTLGETRPDPDAIGSAFEKYAAKDLNLEAVHGLTLASLADQREAADYRLAEPEANETWIAIEAAEHFVEAVKTWIAAQPPR